MLVQALHCRTPFCVARRRVGPGKMAMRLGADLDAVQSFLTTHARTTVGSPSRQVEAAQATALIAKIEYIGYIPVTLATELLNKFAGGSWSPETLASLQKAIADGMASPEGVHVSNVKTQNFLHFERYVTPKLKEVPQNNNISFRSKLTAAAEFLATLGVRCPSERGGDTDSRHGL